MTTTHKDPRAVIEQLVEALEQSTHELKFGNPRTNETDTYRYSNALIHECDAALTAGREALETQEEVVAWMHLEMGTCFSAAQWAVKNSKDPLAKEFVPLCVAQSTVEKCTDERMCAACYSGQGSCENATHPQASEPVGINGLTEAETSASMSVLGLSKPTEPAPSTAGERAEYLTLSAIRAIAVEAIRAVTGCPDIKGNGKYLVDEIDDVAKHAALLQYTPDTRPVGELTDEQIRSIAESVGEEMWPDNGDVGWTDEDTKFHRMFFVRALETARTQPERVPCWCTTCRPIALNDMRFVVCPDCGNKRCPKAHNHSLACTNSNEPGQPGSSWENVKPSAHGITGGEQ